MFLNLLMELAASIYYMALHVTGAGSFPPPLSSAEENELIEKCTSGDEAARNKLIEHNLRLVAHIVKKYYASGCEQEDLISIGTIGLIKAVSTFKNDKGIRLATYAARCIENAILSQSPKMAQMTPFLTKIALGLPPTPRLCYQSSPLATYFIKHKTAKEFINRFIF